MKKILIELRFLQDGYILLKILHINKSMVETS